MDIINQLSDGKTKSFAKHCFERHTKDELEEATKGAPDQAEMEHWGITEGQWEQAVTAALAEYQTQG